MHSPGGHFCRQLQRSSLGLDPSAGEEGTACLSQRRCALTLVSYAPGPKGASALSLKQGVERFAAARGKWMSYTTTSAERALTLRLISSSDGDTWAQEEKGTCPKSHRAGGSCGSHREPRRSAPWRAGGSGKQVRPDPPRAG